MRYAAYLPLGTRVPSAAIGTAIAALRSPSHLLHGFAVGGHPTPAFGDGRPFDA